MKIGLVTGVLTYPHVVREKQDGGASRHDGQSQSDSDQHDSTQKADQQNNASSQDQKDDFSDSESENRAHSDVVPELPLSDASSLKPWEFSGGQAHLRFDAEILKKAILTFRNDQQAQDTGLSVELRREGLSLTVVLKDIHGVVVRQLSGEEFMRLSHTAAPGSTSCGRILDQKL